MHQMGYIFTYILYRNKYGHYEVLKSVNSNNVTVLNSLETDVVNQHVVDI